MITHIFEIIQVAASGAGIPMVAMYLRSALKNKKILERENEPVTSTRYLLAFKEVRIAQTLLTIQIILLIVGLWAELTDRPVWIPPLARTIIAVVVFVASYKLWAKIIPLHTRRSTDFK